MRLRPALFFTHRWLSLIISLQLLAWSLGGFVFSILQLQDVRGRSDSNQIEPAALDLAQVVISPAQALASLTRTDMNVAQSGSAAVAEVRLHRRMERLIYSLFSRERELLGMVDAVTGVVLGEISAEEAESIALADFKHPSLAVEVEYLAADLAGDVEAGRVEGRPQEYRGGVLPAYRVVLDHQREPHIYIDAKSGRVTARRNDLWRVFDFFWMLHIMDYQQREDFNHPLLVAASGFAVLSALSGLVLWGLRLPRQWRRRRRGKS